MPNAMVLLSESPSVAQWSARPPPNTSTWRQRQATHQPVVIYDIDGSSDGAVVAATGPENADTEQWLLLGVDFR